MYFHLSRDIIVSAECCEFRRMHPLAADESVGSDQTVLECRNLLEPEIFIVACDPQSRIAEFIDFEPNSVYGRENWLRLTDESLMILSLL